MPFITPSAPPPPDAAVYRVMVNVPREWESILDGLWLNNIFPSAFDESGIGADAAASVMNNFYGEYLVTDFCGAMAVCIAAVASTPYDELPPGQQQLYDAFQSAVELFAPSGGGGTVDGSRGVVRCQECGTTTALDKIIEVDDVGNIIINNGCGCGGNASHANGSVMYANNAQGQVVSSVKYSQPPPGGVDVPLESTVAGTTDLCAAAITLATSSRTRMTDFITDVNANVTAGQSLADSFRQAATTVPGIGTLFEWEDALRDVWDEYIEGAFEIIEDDLTSDIEFQELWFVAVYEALYSVGYAPGDNIDKSVLRQAANRMPVFYGAGVSAWSPRVTLPVLVQALNMNRVNRDMQLYPLEANSELCDFARGQLGLPVATPTSPVVPPPNPSVIVGNTTYEMFLIPDEVPIFVSGSLVTEQPILTGAPPTAIMSAIEYDFVNTNGTTDHYIARAEFGGSVPPNGSILVRGSRVSGGASTTLTYLLSALPTAANDLWLTYAEQDTNRNASPVTAGSAQENLWFTVQRFGTNTGGGTVSNMKIMISYPTPTT